MSGLIPPISVVVTDANTASSYSSFAYGSFTAPRAQEIIAANNSSLLLFVCNSPDVINAAVFSDYVLSIVVGLQTYRPSGWLRDAVAVTTSCSTLRILAVELCPSALRSGYKFVPLLEFPHARSGIQLLHPGPLLSCDPHGRAIYCGAHLTKAFAAIVTPATEQDTVEDDDVREDADGAPSNPPPSPSAVLRLSALIDCSVEGFLAIDVVSVDMGYGNPLFAVLGSYLPGDGGRPGGGHDDVAVALPKDAAGAAAAPQQDGGQIVLFLEADIGLLACIRRHSVAVGPRCSVLVAPPGISAGPSGVVALSASEAVHVPSGHSAVIPQSARTAVSLGLPGANLRNGGPGPPFCFVAAGVHQSKSGWSVFGCTDDGSVFEFRFRLHSRIVQLEGLSAAREAVGLQCRRVGHAAPSTGYLVTRDGIVSFPEAGGVALSRYKPGCLPGHALWEAGWNAVNASFSSTLRSSGPAAIHPASCAAASASTETGASEVYPGIYDCTAGLFVPAHQVEAHVHPQGVAAVVDPLPSPSDSEPLPLELSSELIPLAPPKMDRRHRLLEEPDRGASDLLPLPVTAAIAVQCSDVAPAVLVCGGRRDASAATLMVRGVPFRPVQCAPLPTDATTTRLFTLPDFEHGNQNVLHVFLSQRHRSHTACYKLSASGDGTATLERQNALLVPGGAPDRFDSSVETMAIGRCPYGGAIQVAGNAVRRVHVGGGDADATVTMQTDGVWRPRLGSLVAGSIASRQIMVATTRGEVYLLDSSDPSGILLEVGVLAVVEPANLTGAFASTKITAVCVPEPSQGQLRSRICFVGCSNNLFHIVSSDQDRPLTVLLSQSLPAPVSAVLAQSHGTAGIVTVAVGMNDGKLAFMQVAASSGSIMSSSLVVYGSGELSLAELSLPAFPDGSTCSPKGFLSYSLDGAVLSTVRFNALNNSLLQDNPVLLDGSGLAAATGFSTPSIPYGVIAVMGKNSPTTLTFDIKLLCIPATVNLSSSCWSHRATTPLPCTPRKLIYIPATAGLTCAYAALCADWIPPIPPDLVAARNRSNIPAHLFEDDVEHQPSASGQWRSVVVLLSRDVSLVASIELSGIGLTAAVAKPSPSSVDLLLCGSLESAVQSSKAAADGDPTFVARVDRALAAEGSPPSQLQQVSPGQGGRMMILRLSGKNGLCADTECVTDLPHVPRATVLMGSTNRFLVATGNSLTLYEPGKKHMLRKCAIQLHSVITSIVALPLPTKLPPSDVQHHAFAVSFVRYGVAFVTYRPADNDFIVTAVTQRPCFVLNLFPVDSSSVMGATKTGEVLLFRAPAIPCSSVAIRTKPERASFQAQSAADGIVVPPGLSIGAPGAVAAEILCNFGFGDDIVMSFISLTAADPNHTGLTWHRQCSEATSHDVLLALTLRGAVWSFVPLDNSATIETLQAIEQSCLELVRPLSWKAHADYRGTYSPVVGAIDGSVLTLFHRLTLQQQEEAVEELQISRDSAALHVSHATRPFM